MTLNEQQDKFAGDVSLLIAFLRARGYAVTFGETYRTEFQQREYYRSGLSKTMNSRHRQRLAIDLNLFKKGKYLTDNTDYKEAGEFWVSLDSQNVAGYFWGWDSGHFERKPI